MRELRAQLALGPRLSKFGGDGRKRTEDATLEDDLHDAEERISHWTSNWKRESRWLGGCEPSRSG